MRRLFVVEEGWSSVFRRRRQEAPSAAAALRPLLFGDLPMEAWPSDDMGETGQGDVWAEFVAARDAAGRGDVVEACTRWQGIVERRDISSRHVLQAWHFLGQHGVEPPEVIARDVLGAVLEVPVRAGHDTLAVYRDGAVRYLNAAGGATVIEGDAPVPQFREPVDRFLAVAEQLANFAGVWDQPELPALPPGHLRAMALTPAGFRFGQGPSEQLSSEPLMGAMMQAGAVVFQEVLRLGPPDRS